MCGTSRLPYLLVTPRTDFEYEPYRSHFLIRGYDMINNVYSWSMADNPKVLAVRIRDQALAILRREATRIAVEGIDYAIRVGLERWVFARRARGNHLVSPLAIASLDRIQDRVISFIGELQSGSFSFNNWRYEGVPIEQP